MKKKSKISTIYDAFTESLPIGEDWYEKRMAICNGCEHNSKNVSPEGLLNKVRKVLDGNKPHCTACGCYLAEKASRKEEACGLSEIGEIPKWNRLVVETANEFDFNLFNNSPERVNVDLSPDGTKYLVLYGEVTEQSNTSIDLVLEGPYEVKTVNVGCGCTLVGFNKASKTLTELKASINLKQVSMGAFTKNIYVRYNLYDGSQKSLTISLSGTKI